ncbi:hypothetical protein MJN47_30630, partial [Salmonella enterica subsp. enterica serovar Lubbock]|nr:hypothetical protein [Salmonella enterica subsp. enterica serovar Lubbock]
EQEATEKLLSLEQKMSVAQTAHSQFEQAYQLVAAINGPLARSALIDMPQNPALRLQIMVACYSAIQKWEPRIRLTSISFERGDT